jgi:acetolactate synthase-1/2/3 large subunit
VCEKLGVIEAEIEKMAIAGESASVKTTKREQNSGLEPVTGILTGEKVCAIVARLQPEDSIIIDESLTSGGSYWRVSEDSPRFTHITLTGGAIGFANAAALGAALAAPHRRVIALIGDGCAQYTVQALWTQARERTRTCTVIMNNASYNILRLECAIQGVPHSSGDVVRSLTDLSSPEIDWVAIARGYGVRGERVKTAEEFVEALRRCLNVDEPTLIDAVLKRE